jgi:hypothetical protein
MMSRLLADLLVPAVAYSICLVSGIAQGQDTKTLQERISVRPFNTTVIGDVERSRDPALLPALRKAFEESEGKMEKQSIARTLIKLGDKDAKYFEFLAGFAKRAVESGAPDFWTYGPDGLIVRGVVNKEFERRCKDHGLDVQHELAAEFRTYPQDLNMLATAHDPRARDILRQGLASRNPLIITSAARGLALLQDRASVPEIIAAASRFPVKQVGFLIAGALSEYEGETVHREILAFLSDPALRELYTKALDRKRMRDQNNP